LVVPDDPTQEVPRQAAFGQWFARQNRHGLFVGILGTILMLNFVGSVVVPYGRYVLVTEPAWEADNARSGCADLCMPPIPRAMVWESLLHSFWMNAFFTMTGLYLFFAPIGWVVSLELFWFPWQPFIWLAAAGSVPLTMRFGTPLGVWTRAAYAVAIALLLSGFLASVWSTIGN
jgi:hypothetical protein